MTEPRNPVVLELLEREALNERLDKLAALPPATRLQIRNAILALWRGAGESKNDVTGCFEIAGGIMCQFKTDYRPAYGTDGFGDEDLDNRARWLERFGGWDEEREMWLAIAEEIAQGLSPQVRCVPDRESEGATP